MDNACSSLRSKRFRVVAHALVFDGINRGMLHQPAIFAYVNTPQNSLSMSFSKMLLSQSSRLAIFTETLSL